MSVVILSSPPRLPTCQILFSKSLQLTLIQFCPCTLIRDYSERILLGVAMKYGKNSDEYEMAGGIRKSERKRPVRKMQAFLEISV